MINNQINLQNIPEEIKQSGNFCIHQNKIPLAKTNDKGTKIRIDKIMQYRKL